MDTTLLASIRRNWWLVLLRGIAAVAFGVLAWVWPGITLISLALVWGAYALVDGVCALWSGWQTKDHGKPMWQVILIGVLGIAAGLFTFAAPGLTAIALLTLIAAWAIVNGVFQIAAAIRLRKEIASEWLMILSGALSIVFGGLMLTNLEAGALAVAWLIGAFAIAYGALLVVLSFRLKSRAAPQSKPAMA
ncbi:MAG TPA: HdeD family acid-resistance protein [Burkholderiaceae bacterium]|nr:HdeD family acid-resistance protein [Burkholderiaceae bacterium]HQR70722.1 HdeD family acid-resistance protein [Burkholderiaceae bacterium]